MFETKDLVCIVLHVPVHEILVLIAYAKAQASLAAHLLNITRAFAARIHKVWMKIKTQNKFKGYASMGVLRRLLRMCDKYQSIVC